MRNDSVATHIDRASFAAQSSKSEIYERKNDHCSSWYMYREKMLVGYVASRIAQVAQSTSKSLAMSMSMYSCRPM